MKVGSVVEGRYTTGHLVRGAEYRVAAISRGWNGKWLYELELLGTGPDGMEAEVAMSHVTLDDPELVRVVE